MRLKGEAHRQAHDADENELVAQKAPGRDNRQRDNKAGGISKVEKGPAIDKAKRNKTTRKQRRIASSVPDHKARNHEADRYRKDPADSATGKGNEAIGARNGNSVGR